MKKRNRKRGKVDKLPCDIRETVDMMINNPSEYRYSDIVDFIRENGYEVSKSSVARYAQALNASLEQVMLISNNFRLINEELAKYPDLDVSEALARLTNHKVMEAIQNLSDDSLKDVPPEKLIATTNPDVPTHWLKKEYIDNAKVDMLVLRFLIDDNTTLPEEYVREIKKEYTGVYFERFICGNWVAAEGVIYPLFADNPSRYIVDTLPEDLMFVTIGGDFGGNGSAHTLNATGFTKGFQSVVTLDEYYRKETISPYELENDFCNFIEGVCRRWKCTEIYLDSAEQILIKGVRLAAQRRKLRVNIHNARKGSINNRILFYNRLIAADRYKIMSHCKHTIEAFQTAIWKPNVTTEIRLDDGSINIDSLDAQEYSTEAYMTNVFDAERKT